jgi:hypothetical protein
MRINWLFNTSLKFSIFGIAFFTCASSFAAMTWESQGSVDVEARNYPQAIGQARSSEIWTGATLDLEGKFRRWRIRSVVKGHFLSAGRSDPGTVNQSGSPHAIEDQELNLEYRYRGHRIRVGTTVLRWGIVDLYDPLDQVNSRRFENPLATSKRGDPMLYWTKTAISAQGTAFISEVYLIPFKRPSLMPSQASAWLPRQIYIPNLPDTEFVLPEALEYQYAGREELDDSLHSNYGARIGWRFSESEISFQYDEGGTSYPALRPTVSGTVIALIPRTRIQADPLIQLTEVYFRERHFGASVTSAFNALLVRAQVAKTEPMFTGRKLARDRSDFTIGLEYGFSNSTLLAQIFFNSLAQNDGGNDLASFSSVFDRATALGWRLSLSETASLMVGAMHSAPGPAGKNGTVAIINSAFDVSDNLSCELGWTVIEAEPEAPLGPFKENDGGYFKLTASF